MTKQLTEKGFDGTEACVLPKRKPLKWTRKNLLKVANEIYNPKTGEYLHLCTGRLQDTNKGERMSCAVGHLWWRFNGTDSSYVENGINHTIGTDTACARLARANVLTPWTRSEQAVFESLEELYNLNDNAKYTRFRDRARAVAHYIRTKLAPLVANG